MAELAAATAEAALQRTATDEAIDANDDAAAGIAAEAAAVAEPEPTLALTSSATLGMVEVGLVAETLLGNELNDALREQTLTIGQLRRAIAAKLSTTTESRLKEDTAPSALLKEKMIAMHQLETQRTAAAAAKAPQGGNNATSDAPARSSSKTDDAPTADTAPAPARGGESFIGHV